jgi:hypothetical protein
MAPNSWCVFNVLTKRGALGPEYHSAAPSKWSLQSLSVACLHTPLYRNVMDCDGHMKSVKGMRLKRIGLLFAYLVSTLSFAGRNKYPYKVAEDRVTCNDQFSVPQGRPFTNPLTDEDPRI